MIRRRIVIEWDDDGTDTDNECLEQFIKGDFDVQDLLNIDVRCHVQLQDAYLAVTFVGYSQASGYYIGGAEPLRSLNGH